MKDGVVLINCARGGLYNEEALVENLKMEKLQWLELMYSKRACNFSSTIRFTKCYSNCSLRSKYKESQKRSLFKVQTMQ